jgi:hypothetical protein
MTIHITQPEIEALIQERLRSGAFRDAEEVILDALRSSAESSRRPQSKQGRKSLAQLFAESPLKGLDLRFERNQDTGRPVNL